MITLYIKIHNITGLKYFGKTTKLNPYKYRGSGKYWIKHISKHGNDVTTKIIAAFDDIEQCKKFAIQFSVENNISNSREWANLRDENGQDGAPSGHVGHKFTTEQKKKMSIRSKERWKSSEYRNMVGSKQKESWTEDRKKQQSERLLGGKRPQHSAFMKAKPRHENFRCLPQTDGQKKKISVALTGKKKTNEHKRKVAKAKQLDWGLLIDHHGNSYEIYADFLRKFSLDRSFICNLESKITTPTLNKLGVDPKKYKNFTPSSLGIRFEEK